MPAFDKWFNLQVLFNDTHFVEWAGNTLFVGVIVVIMTAADKFTIGVGVPTFLVRGDVYFWGSLMAACFIASVPIAIVYNLFVDRFIAGFAVGAVKG